MRFTTYKIIEEFENEQIYINLRLKNMRKTPEEMKQITIRVYGIVQNYTFLKFIVNETTKPKKLDEKTIRILILALYEHLYLDSVPEYAVISEYTNLCHRVNPKAVKFVSYYLNNNLTITNEIEPKFTNETKNISIKYSHPQWLVKQLMRDYPDNYLDILKANQQVKKMYVRKVKPLINNDDFLKTDYEDLLIAKGNVIQSEDFQAGNVIIQDFGSYLVGKIVAAKNTETVLDLCAAPGNKTRHIASTAKYVVANEINHSRYQLLKENVADQNCFVINADATNKEQLNEAINSLGLETKFDKVLIDAPCSGWGVFGSKPEAKYYQNQQEISNILKIQKQILDNAQNYLKADGELIYSTCTINKDENERQLQQFMLEYNFVEITDYDNENQYKNKAEIGITLLPYTNDSDGFFMCKMRRK